MICDVFWDTVGTEGSPSLAKKALRSANVIRLLSVSCAVAALMPYSVHAQEAAPAAEEASRGGLEEIVVTAEKREANVQKTAIAIDVVNSEKLAKSGVADINSLSTIAPGVQIATATTATIITVRGVSGRDFTEIGDPAVAINLDGIFLQRPTGMNAAFFDLDRIEVLRGPQGTLYGRNATGGVINIITKRPNWEFGGYGALTVGNYKTLNAEGAINVPISDTLAMRASFISRRHDGYRDNRIPATGNPAVDIPGVGSPANRAKNRGDDEDTQGARLQLLFKPSDRFSALISGTYITQGGIGPVAAGYPTTRPEAPTKFSEAKAFPLNTVGDFDATRKNLSAQLEYDFGGVKATYLFGYAGLDITHLNDNDGTAVNTPRGTYGFRRAEFSDDYSHELRLASNGDGPFNWQIGGFLYDQKLKIRSINFQNPAGTPLVLRNFLFDVDVKSKAVFGQVNYEVIDGLKLSGGVRYSKDTKARTGGRWQGPSLTASYTTQPPLVFLAETAASRSSDTDWSYHFGVDYQVTPQSMLYAKVDKGYKSGGFTSINTYGPETVIAYEIGSKNRFFDNTLQLNLTGFHYDYRDQQVSTLTAAGTAVLNAGSSKVDGIEAQLDWRATSNTTIDLSVNWLDAKYKDFAVAVGGVNVSQAGHRLIQAPEWSLSGGIEHRFEFGNGGSLTPRAQALYRSESYYTFFNNRNDRQRPYGTVDLSLTYDAPDKAWSLQAYVRNLTNTVSLAGVSVGSFIGTNTYIFAPPRTYGARLQASF